jgi:hypothetical protein
MAASLKQKWLRILTDIAENAEDSKTKIEALRLAMEIQGQQKPAKDKISNKLADILSGGSKQT